MRSVSIFSRVKRLIDGPRHQEVKTISLIGLEPARADHPKKARSHLRDQYIWNYGWTIFQY